MDDLFSTFKGALILAGIGAIFMSVIVAIVCLWHAIFGISSLPIPRIVALFVPLVSVIGVLWGVFLIRWGAK